MRNHPVGYWLALADAVLRAARALFRAGHRRQTVLFCHFTVEKGLKAAIRKQTGKSPPKMEELPPLLRRAGCELPPDLKAFVGKLGGYSVSTLCQLDSPVPTRRFSQVFTNHCLLMTSRVHRWLKRAVS